MNIEQLQRFLVVADCLSFTVAAERLYVGQSTVSRQIAALEEELGVILLVRGPRSVALTEAGQLLKDEADKLMKYIENIKKRVSSAGNGSVGTVRLTSVPAVFHALDQIYARSAEVYPDIKLSLSHSKYANVCQDLDLGSADVGLTYSFLIPNSEVYEFIPLYEEHFCVLCSSKHRLADREGIYLDELRDVNITFGRNSILFIHNPQPYQGEPPSDDRNPELSMEGTLMQLLVSDDVVILPSSSVQLNISQSKNLACVPMLDEDLKHAAGVIFRRDNKSPVLARFLEVVRRCLMESE